MAKGNQKAGQIRITPGVLTPTDVTGEVVAVPAGAAGSVVDFFFEIKPILDSNDSYIGGKGDTSIALTSTAFTTEVAYETPDADLANGEFWVDYIRGRGRGKKADGSTSQTADYSYFA